jgi:hypothetical protein
MPMTVFEREPSPPRDTGLVDAGGRRIMATEEKPPIGFIRFTTSG